MKQPVPLDKRSKKERKDYYAAQRGSWHGLCPVSRIVPSRKAYDRRRQKQLDRKALF